jgi:hypothetical protein
MDGQVPRLSGSGDLRERRVTAIVLFPGIVVRRVSMREEEEGVNTCMAQINRR